MEQSCNESIQQMIVILSNTRLQQALSWWSDQCLHKRNAVNSCLNTSLQPDRQLIHQELCACDGCIRGCGLHIRQNLATCYGLAIDTIVMSNFWPGSSILKALTGVNSPTHRIIRQLRLQKYIKAFAQRQARECRTSNGWLLVFSIPQGTHLSSIYCRQDNLRTQQVLYSEVPLHKKGVGKEGAATLGFPEVPL